MDDQPASDTESRIATIAATADLHAVAGAMAERRDLILGHWLEATARQPFHQERSAPAVADHVPRLFDAVVALVERDAAAVDPVTPPMDDPDVAREAEAHAKVRFEQGLGPVAIVTEFRLLRQEISRALAAIPPDHTPPKDIVGGLAVVNDALDGAATVGLTALSDRIETLREAFLATTMHDVRQPITLMEGSLVLAERWLAEPTAELPRVREAVADALTATSELMAMVETLSDASRVAMGALEPDLEPASLEAIVRDALEVYGRAGRGRLQVEVPTSRDLIGAWDAALLRRLVANLVGNALKYSSDGGAVEVTVGPGTPGFARLVVRDHGLGMTREELDSVFDRFARGDRARRHGIPGLGLGMYACHGIVAAHGGTIVVDSGGPDQGTTVIVDLPLLDVSALED